MWLFWIVAGALAAAAAALIVVRATRAARAAAQAPEDPALAVYRRQLAEIDELAERGLLADEERRAAHAEAGRRLLSAAEHAQPQERGGAGGPRVLVLGGLAAAVLASLGLYLALGSPGFPDMPFRSRLAAWRADPERLRPAEMAAVLRVLTDERPRDPQAWEFLGRAQLQAGDPLAAAGAIRRAIALQPNRAELQILLGEALMTAAEGKSTPEAEAAFRRAVELDPKNLAARYFLARARIAAGDREGGLAAWNALKAEMPAGDPRIAMLEQDMAQALGQARPDAAGAAEQNQEQAAFIRGMVARLAARLETAPDDPEGWARLVRAYRVLGDKAAEAKALDRARKLFAGRPQDLARIEAEASPRR